MSFGSTLRKVLATPWWLLQLGTGAKSFIDNPLIGSRRLNRFGLHALRVKAAHRLAAMRRARLAKLVSENHRAALGQQGYVVVPDVLPDAEFQVLRQKILGLKSPVRQMVQGDTITRRIAIDPDFLSAVPEVRKLLSLPLWRGLVRYVSSFNVEPLYYVQVIIRDAGDAPLDPQTTLHADTFHPTMKAWFFLNDVDEDVGAFTYVRGSHELTPERLAWERERSLSLPSGVDRLADRGSPRIQAADLPALGLPQPQALGAKANTLVVADTFGFHARGAAPSSFSRVEIWAYSRRNPFLPFTGLDLLSVPGIAERRVTALWALRDLFKRYFGQPWQTDGVKQPLER